MGSYIVNSELFARILFSRNFANFAKINPSRNRLLNVCLFTLKAPRKYGSENVDC